MSSLGAEIIKGSGSRVRFSIRDERITVHRPHPGSEIGKPAIREIRDYLIRLGVEP